MLSRIWMLELQGSLWVVPDTPLENLDRLAWMSATVSVLVRKLRRRGSASFISVRVSEVTTTSSRGSTGMGRSFIVISKGL